MFDFFTFPRPLFFVVLTARSRLRTCCSGLIPPRPIAVHALIASSFSNERSTVAGISSSDPLSERSDSSENSYSDDSISSSAVEPLVKLCYKQEGDAKFLCVTTYDHWQSVLNRLQVMTSEHTSSARRRQFMPHVADIVATIHPDSVIAQDQAMTDAGRLVRPVYEKMHEDTVGRLEQTLKVMRACRLFGYRFIAQTSIASLRDEVVQLMHIQGFNETGENMFQQELDEYKKYAMAAMATGRAAVLLANDAAAVTAADVAVAATNEAARVAAVVIANAPTVHADAITTALAELEAVKLSLDGDEEAIAAANATGLPAAEAAGAAAVATAAAEAAATAVLVADATAKQALAVAAAVEVANAALFQSDTDFWDAHQLTLPTWWAASNEIALISPSSASAERLFSLLTQGFDSSQMACLSDYKFASAAIRYNKTGENINFM